MQNTYQITATKRDGRTITGTIRDDGLQSLWVVETPNGSVEYITVLDTITEKILLGRTA